MLYGRYLLAVDIGTTRTKGIILDDKADVVANSSLTHSDIVPHPGWHEQDAENVWWGEFVTTVRHLLNISNISTSHIECICITGMFTCFCPTDELGVPLCHALLYDDTRAIKYIQQLHHSDASSFKGNELLPRLMWFRNTFPDLQLRLQKVFSTHSFIVYRLTGRYCTDGHTARGFGRIFEPETFSWKREEHLRAEVEEKLLPEVLPPRAVAGYVTSQAAKETGLISGIPVLVGAGDMFESLVSCGAHQPSDVMIHYGSGGALSQLTKDINYVLGAQAYIGGDEGVRWLMVLYRSGKQLERFTNLLNWQQAKSESSVSLQYLSTLIDISRAPSRPILFLHDTGQSQEFAIARPMLATFLAIPLDATVTDIYRAMLEGFGFRIRQCAENTGLTECKLKWYAAGGGTQSHAWCQIVTDIINQEQIVCGYGDSAFGGALIAGHAVALFDLEKVIQNRIKHATVYRPQQHLRYYYDQQYQKYLYASRLLENYQEQNII